MHDFAGLSPKWKKRLSIKEENRGILLNIFVLILKLSPFIIIVALIIWLVSSKLSSRAKTEKSENARLQGQGRNMRENYTSRPDDLTADEEANLQKAFYGMENGAPCKQSDNVTRANAHRRVQCWNSTASTVANLGDWAVLCGSSSPSTTLEIPLPTVFCTPPVVATTPTTPPPPQYIWRASPWMNPSDIPANTEQLIFAPCVDNICMLSSTSGTPTPTPVPSATVPARTVDTDLDCGSPSNADECRGAGNSCGDPNANEDQYTCYYPRIQ